MGKLICIKTYPNRIDAEIAKGFLEKNGIKAIISADDAGGILPNLLWSTGGAKLLVKKEDKEAATRFLSDRNER